VSQNGGNCVTADAVSGPAWDWAHVGWLQSQTMGDGSGGAAGVATIEGEAGSAVSDQTVEDSLAPRPKWQLRPDEPRRSKRRFTWAALIATTVVAVPYLWVLWGPWESPNPLRKTVFEGNFYDLQARAMFHGHLWLAKGAIGIEAFVHGGHEYTYFGLFPSLIRMPVLLVTSRLDGKLTAPAMLLAWLLTAMFVSLLIWRVRILIRGAAPLGRLEASALGVLIATALGGTIVVFLAATPFVFNEDLAWSICLTIGSLFALLGVVERPSWGRVITSFVLILCANLDRATTGWACVVAAGLIGIWFGLGRLGREHRRWCLPMIGVGAVSLAISCAVNYSKFGVLFGVSNFEQVWTHVNAYRQKFLAANHNAEEGVIFVRSNVLAYLRPDGIRITPNFPFITLPASPATALGGVLFDRRYRTASLPASTPLLFGLSLWGLITAFRPKPIGRVAATRILLLSAGSAGAALLLWGYIAPRYLGDFVPFLVLGSAVAMIDIWRRLRRHSREARLVVLAAISLVAAYSIVANFGMAITPNEEWTTAQVLNYANAQKTASDITGHSLRGQVRRGSELPPWAPADEYFIVGDCDGLYISNGEDYSTVPSQQFQRTTWMAVERGHAFEHTFRVTAAAPPPGRLVTRPLVTIGKREVAVTVRRAPDPRFVQLIFGQVGASGADNGRPVLVPVHSTQLVTVVTDPATRLINVTMGGRTIFTRHVEMGRPSAAGGPTQLAGSSSPLSVVNETASSPQPTLCQSLNNR
jgi:hypothetical protein